MKEIRELVQVSNEIGEFKDLVQAGGGNSSVKTKDGKMLIKASGFTFSEMTESKGFAIIDYKKVADFFENHTVASIQEENEGKYNQSLFESMLDNSYRPSMETGMHVFLDRVVIHTHPVMANIINCMEDGEKLAHEIFSKVHQEIMWVDYKNPGYSLAKEIKSKVASYESKNGIKPGTIFLKNHGIIVSSESSSKCLATTVEINENIYSYLKDNFGLEKFTKPQIKLKNDVHVNDSEIVKRFVMNLNDKRQLLSKFLIPDDAVYCSEFSIDDTNNLNRNNMTFIENVGVFYPWDENKSAKVNEMLSAKLYILSALEKIGEACFLKDEDVNYILNMESEKYRQKLNKVE